VKIVKSMRVILFFCNGFQVKAEENNEQSCIVSWTGKEKCRYGEMDYFMDFYCVLMRLYGGRE
jgi:hypothetical protein